MVKLNKQRWLELEFQLVLAPQQPAHATHHFFHNSPSRFILGGGLGLLHLYQEQVWLCVSRFLGNDKDKLNDRNKYNDKYKHQIL